MVPNVPLAVTRSLSGVFHGHLAHLGLVFADRVDPDDVRDALSQTEGIEIADLPVSLDGVADRDFAIITPPVMSPDGRQLAVTAMADGLRVGGALTAIDILENPWCDPRFLPALIATGGQRNERQPGIHGDPVSCRGWSASSKEVPNEQSPRVSRTRTSVETL